MPLAPPSLPNSDPDPNGRLAELLDAQAAWQRGKWADLEAFAARTPFRDMPTIPWVFRLLPGAARNALNGFLYDLRAWFGNVPKALPAGFATRSLMGSPAASLSKANGSNFQKAQRVVGLRAYRVVDWTMARTLGVVDGTTRKRAQLSASRPSDYKRVYAAVRPPPVTKAWQGEVNGLTDELFASLRLAGSNPEVIARAVGVPEGFDPGIATPTGSTLAARLAAGHLFVCDYSPLRILENSLWNDRPRYVHCPIALFELDGASLRPVAIQPGPGLPVVLPQDAAWMAAKYTVQVADGNHHELVSHLARTHLLTELALLATHQNLSKRHPIARLLLPHFEGTVFINDHARASLIAPGGPIDQIFAGTLSSSQALSVQALATLDFSTYDLPTRTAARHTEAIADYPYRDDALRVWAAVAAYTEGVVQVVYADDAAMMADPEWQAWSAALASPVAVGGIPGFAAAKTRSELARQLSTIIFTASAQHAAVNFPQFPYMSFAPLLSGSQWAEAPTATDAPPFLEFLPPMELAHQQAEVLYLLSSIHHTRLGANSRFNAPSLDALADRFRAALVAVEAEIQRGNQTRSTPYTMLLPSRIPTSINI